MGSWERIEPTEVEKAGFRTVVHKTFRLPDGTIDRISTVNPEHWAGAGIIALTEDNQVVMTRQFRGAQEMVMDEIPGGVVDDGEEPKATALRELLQETGYVPVDPESVEYLGFCYYDGYTNGKRHYFLATNCVLSEAGQHEQSSLEQGLEVYLVGISTLFAIAKTGRMTDPGAVLLAYDRLKELEAQ